jgi:hypothetical protein
MADAAAADSGAGAGAAAGAGAGAAAVAVATAAASLLANASSALALAGAPGGAELTAAEAQYAAMQAEALAAHAGHNHPRSRREAGFVLWSTVAALVLAQAALVRFKRFYPRAYAGVTLLGLWLAPCAFAIAHRGLAFLALWAAFTACAGALFLLARAKPLAKETPRRVYKWLDLTYRACLAVASAAWAAIVAPLLIPTLALAVPVALVDVVVQSLLFSVYFGVLTRDVGELAAETMTANLGQRGGGGGGKRDEDEGEGRAAARRLAAQYSCALCGDELRIVGEGSAVEAGGEDGGLSGEDGAEGDDALAHITEPVAMRTRSGALVLVMPGSPAAQQLEAAARARIAAAAAAAKAAAAEALAAGEQPQQQKVLAFKDARRPHGDPLYQLQCAHVFHEACIKGWCIIGKKDTCPTCSERVDIKALLKTSPLWGQTSRLWGQLLDAVRYVVVWNPLIFLVLRFFFSEMGIGKPDNVSPSPSPGPAGPLGLPAPGVGAAS